MAPYKVDGVLPAEVVAAIPPGTNLLVSGPPMTGKRRLMLRLLARGERDGEGSVVVTSREPAPDVLSSYGDLLAGEPGRVSVIDSVSARGDIPRMEDDDRVRYVSSPSDLTGIGIEFSNVTRNASEAGVDRLRVGLDSLSPMLMYVDLQRLFRFLHVFTSQVQSQDWVGFFVVDPESHDQQDVTTLQQLFDGVLELRLTDDGDREVRVRGITDRPTGWAALE